MASQPAEEDREPADDEEDRCLCARVDRTDRTSREEQVHGTHEEADEPGKASQRASEETELLHLQGFLDSRPVRVGNAAEDQRQVDVYGEFLDSATFLARVDPAFVRDRWPVVERLADRTTRLWTESDRGIWESRGTPEHFVHSKLMCWVALDRAIGRARLFGRTDPVDRWARTADEIRAAILARGYDPATGSFVQAFNAHGLDANALRIPLTGFLPSEDPRVLSTIDAIERLLAEGAFVHRYETDDGLAGPEGAFLLSSFWLVECLAKCGRIDRARGNWHSLLDAADPLLFSEQYDPRATLPLRDYPQAFTHIGVLRAALALGLVASIGWDTTGWTTPARGEPSGVEVRRQPKGSVARRG